MQKELVVDLNKFRPRPYQLELIRAFEQKGYKRLLVIWPRRAGKDFTAFNLMLRAALKRIATYYIVLPTFSQGRRVIWDAITNDGVRFRDFIPTELIAKTNEQLMRITLINGSQIQIVGSDNYDALVGVNLGGAIFSEYALQDPRGYQFLRPVLTANEGWAIFISTPRGKNSLYELYQIAKQHADWWVSHLSVEDTQHISIDLIDKERNEGLMSEDLIQQEYYCFPAGQHIMTDLGSVPIENIKENDLVISHSGRLRKVLKTISRDYIGELIKISSYGSSEDIICTPNHPIRVYNQEYQSYSWKEAGKITINDRLVFPKKTLGKIPILTYELCMLLAWYITEGSCFKNGVQWTVKPEEAIVISNYLNALSISWKVSIGDGVVNVLVNSVQLVDFFKSNCGLQSNHKRIPFNLISGHEKEFFHELMKGDGCYSISKGHEKYVYTTVSKTLAYQVQLLAHSLNLGYAAGISVRKSYDGIILGRSVRCQISYQINISFPGLRNSSSWLIRAKNCIAAKITNISRFDFTGKVYNFSVQYDESYVVHGRAVHNCSFDMGVEGSYYAKYIDRARLEYRIGTVPWESGFPVHTAWDIGVRDSSVIIFFQQIGQTVRVIDYYENSKEGLEHYARVLSEKPYTYGQHIAPHDIAVKEFTSGMTRIEKAKQLGIKFRVAPSLSIMDGIEAVRSMFGRVWIDDKKCSKLIKSLENYRQEWDARKNVYKSHPLHDANSHAADAFRYLAITLPKMKDGLTQEDIDRKYKEKLYGSSLPKEFIQPNERFRGF